MVIKIQEFEKPKRKYTRKTKSVDENPSCDEEIKISNDLKQLKLNESESESKISLNVNQNVEKSIFEIISIRDFEFTVPINIYLSCMIEPISKDINKYIYYTSIYYTI